MFAHLTYPRGPCRVRSWWLLAILLFLCPAAAPAQPTHPPSRTSTVATVSVATAAHVVPALSWKDIYNPVEGFVGNRRRMLQTLIVLMCLALFIIWWRK